MQNPPGILLIDDDRAFRTVTSSLLEDEGYQVDVAESAETGLKLLQEKPYDLVLSDMKMEGMDGLEFMRQLKARFPKLMVMMITGFASVDSAVEAMKIGAEDYLTKPCSNAELLMKISKILEHKRTNEELEQLRTTLTGRYQFSQIIGKSERMQEVFSVIEQVATTDATVLILGETGTGKELVAKAIHFNSTRKSRPFVAVNSAALPETLLESELFGHEKGAFSGAIQQKPGRFELAHSGTLFLDEVGDIPLPTQVKLLRVLQEKTFERVGGTRTLQTNIRVISATNKNLKNEIAAHKFREDFYFRLNVMPIHLPALRERREDIPLLAYHFLQHFAKNMGKTTSEISVSALKLLLNYHWPGNVRELENVIERAMILCNGPAIDVEHLSFYDQSDAFELLKDARKRQLPEQELTEIYARMMLQAHQGNKKETCKTLGINFRTLQNRLGES